MKTITLAMDAHLLGEVTSLASLWKITRTDGTVMGFTDHDEDIVYGGVTYKASTGWTRSQLQETSNFAVNTADIMSLLDDVTITKADLRAGKYNHAAVEMFMINWEDHAMGVIKVTRGWYGEVVRLGDKYSVEYRNIMKALEQNICETYSERCRADLGDARCGVDVSTLWQNGSVVSVTSRQKFRASGIRGLSSPLDNTPPAPSIVLAGGGHLRAGEDVWLRAVLITAAGKTTMGFATKISNTVLNNKITVSLPALPGWMTAVTGWEIYGAYNVHNATEPNYNQYVRLNEPSAIAVLSSFDIDHIPTPSELSTTWTPLGGTQPPDDDSSNLGTSNPLDYFNVGLLTWLTGANAGLSMEIKYLNSSTIELNLFLPMGFPVVEGDTFQARPGCNKTMANCNAFGAILNFRGEPHVPGRDKVLAYPNIKTT
jgi:hypothetical protein